MNENETITAMTYTRDVDEWRMKADDDDNSLTDDEWRWRMTIARVQAVDALPNDPKFRKKHERDLFCRYLIYT